MSMAHSQNEIKGKSLVELAEQLEAEIREAAREGKSLYDMEKDIFGRALQIGHAAIEQVLALQGDGDLGQSVVTKNGRRLERSEEPAERPCGRCSANIPSGPTSMLPERTKQSNCARSTRD